MVKMDEGIDHWSSEHGMYYISCVMYHPNTGAVWWRCSVVVEVMEVVGEGPLEAIIGISGSNNTHRASAPVSVAMTSGNGDSGSRVLGSL